MAMCRWLFQKDKKKGGALLLLVEGRQIEKREDRSRRGEEIRKEKKGGEWRSRLEIRLTARLLVHIVIKLEYLFCIFPIRLPLLLLLRRFNNLAKNL